MGKPIILTPADAYGVGTAFSLLDPDRLTTCVGPAWDAHLVPHLQRAREFRLSRNTNLGEGQRLGGGTANSADALLHQSHGELLVGHAVPGAAHVLGLVAGYVEVYPEEYVLEALGGVVHEAELEPLLVEEALGEGATQRVRGQRALLRVLQLREQVLKKNNKENAR